VAQTTSPRISFELRSDELEQVLEVSILFLRISQLLQGEGDPRDVRGLTARLKQLRPFLERFDKVATAQTIVPPTSALDFVSQEGVYSLVTTLEGVRVCGAAALMFLNIYHALPKSLPVRTSDPIQLYPKKH